MEVRSRRNLYFPGHGRSTSIALGGNLASTNLNIWSGMATVLAVAGTPIEVRSRRNLYFPGHGRSTSIALGGDLASANLNIWSGMVAFVIGAVPPAEEDCEEPPVFKLLGPLFSTVSISSILNTKDFDPIYTTVILPEDAPDQTDFPLPPPIHEVLDQPIFVPAKNVSGGTRILGEVLAWKIERGSRVGVETPNVTNIYDPAGVVCKQASGAEGINDNNFGHLVCWAPVMNVKVMGSTGLTAGSPLKMTAGQNYLVAQSSPDTGALAHFIILQDHEIAEVQMKRVRVKIGIY